MIGFSGCAACGDKRGTIDGLPLCPPCAKALLRVSMPPRGFCPVCLSKLTRSGRCPVCAEGQARLIDATRAPFLYRGVVRSLILRIKFHDDTRGAPVLAAMMLKVLDNRDFDLVVPVPLSLTRIRERGFNQAALLAYSIACELGAPMREALERTRNTKRQSLLSGTVARRKNVEGAFSVRPHEALKGLHLLLVDDVRTTGATARACAKALKDAGAESVTLLVAAIAPNAGRRVGYRRTWRDRLT